MPDGISVVIPTFNEEARIVGTLKAVTAYLQARALSAEIIVSDDGSQDGTCRAVGHLMADGLPIRLLRSPRNLGKGSAIRCGVLASRATLVLLSDADLATPIEEIDRLLERLRAGTDIVIASRGLRDSRIQIRQPLARELLGRTFNLLVQVTVVPGIWDTQCGFKLFRGSVARHLFGLSRINGFAFDVEILGLARRLGYTVAEVPVRWRHVSESKMRVGRDGVKMLADLARVVYRLHISTRLGGDASTAAASAVEEVEDRVAADISEPSSATPGSGQVAVDVAGQAEKIRAQNEEEIRRLAAADSRSWWVRGRRLVVAAVLRQHLKDRPSGPVADLGCGAGGMFPVLREHGTVVGVDLSPIAVEFCRARGYPGLVVGALETLPLVEECVALIVMTDVLEHIEDDARVLNECVRALKPGGTILITVPAIPWLSSEHDWALGHLRRYSYRQLAGLLSTCGLRVDRMTYFNTLLLPLVLLVRSLRRTDRAHPRADPLEPPRPLNWLLVQILAIESRLLRFLDLPIGLSLLAVAHKGAEVSGVGARPHAGGGGGRRTA